MSISVDEKKAFIAWLNDHVDFGRREVYWILNYLVNHAAILAKVTFVENANKTPRGVRISQAGSEVEGLELYLNGRTFTDSEQVFHELRMNWKKELFMEISFDHSWNSPEYLAVLADNPFYSWNDTVDSEVEQSVLEALAKEQKSNELIELYHEIDQALESGNQAEFQRLTSSLKEN
ncbi:YpiB family protein [uncultured Vagococcus sp.]|uniref:YpiB family protein n=1 Tax=uncultured Vagococcus sp. TaxID=189676 RepID=UPI0028D261AE|nr:YpiB family protein [uncultured Vagococcus sp.]